MKYSALEFISKYKHNSIFIKIFVLVNILALVLMGVFYLFSVQMVSKNLKEKTYLSNQNMLNKTKNSVDITFSYLDQLLMSLTEESNIVSAVVVPGIHRYDRNFNIINNLSFAAEKNSLINKIILFVPFDGSFFTSEKQIGIIQNPADYPLISGLYNKVRMVSAGPDDRPSDIITHNERIYLMREFPLTGEARMGVIFFELSTEGLYRIIQGDYTVPGNTIFVFDAENKLLFASHIKTKAPGILENRKDIIESGTTVWFQSASERLGWRYLYNIDAEITQTSYSATLAMILPLLVFLFIFSVLLSLYISRNIYSPIESLIRSITADAEIVDPSSQVKNEIEYIDTVFTRTVAQKEIFANTIKEISPEVLEKLFTQLLTGRTVDPVHVKATLRDLNSSFCRRGKFTVFVISIMNADYHSVSEIEESLYTVSIENLVRDFTGDRFALHVQLMGGAYVAAVFNYSPDVPILSIKQFEADLVRYLATAVRNTTFRVFIEKGGMYEAIEDIRFSYEEAKRLLSYHRYTGGQERYMSESPGEREEEFSHNYFHLRMNNVSRLVEEGRINDAIKSSESMLNSIIACGKEVGEIRLIFSVYLDVLIETLFSLNIQYGKIDIDQELSQITRLEDMLSFMQDLTRNVVDLMQEYYQKRQHKYLVAAKSYIEEKYFDNMLSLNSVADYVHANPTYLSKLFKENLGIHFIDYLNMYRLDKAKSMLLATRLTIKEIGFKTGFNSQQNFIRVFKKYEGLTPGRYREVKPAQNELYKE